MKQEKIKRTNKLFKKEAIQLMADIFSHVSKKLHMDIKVFFTLLNKTEYSDRIYYLDPIYVCGKSSIEIVHEILAECKVSYKVYDKDVLFMPDVNDWTGLIVASYCLAKKVSFKTFEKMIDINVIKRMYYPLHEAPHMKAIETIDEAIKLGGSKLGTIRTLSKLSQSELSTLSGVSLRSIQMYEQGHKDINKASFDTVRNLAYALHISTDELYDASAVPNDELVSFY